MKKSLTFIFAAALLVSCQQEENEATTPANSLACYHTRYRS